MTRKDRRRPSRALEDDVALLVQRLEPLVQQLQQLKKEAAALGIFTDDRELLQCPGCGLSEDVAIGGLLMTYFEPELSRDTGLRFIEISTPREYRCPSCGGVVHEPEETT